MVLHWNRGLGITWLASSLGTDCFSGGIGGVSVMSRPYLTCSNCNQSGQGSQPSISLLP